MTLAELNASAQAPFVQAVGWVFEHSSWVAARAWSSRPFASVDALHAAMVEAVAGASREEQAALLRAHPDLGTRTRLTKASGGEQASAGLDRLTSAARERLLALNDAYRTRFGFPFILAVTGATPAQIVAALEQRLGSTPDREWADALAQVARIARGRLTATVQ